MLNEIKAEIIQLTANTVFTRNLSLTLMLAIACLCSLAELQSKNFRAVERVFLTNISHSSSITMILKHR